MALGKGVNSYATVAEADTYFETRLDVAAWLEASEDEKAKALVTATSHLDSLDWDSVALSATQPLAFPMKGTYLDPRTGEWTPMHPYVPQRIVTATFELAYHFLNNDGILDDTGSVTDLSVAGIQLTNIREMRKIPSVVKRLIRPLQTNSKSSTWWRAN